MIQSPEEDRGPIFLSSVTNGLARYRAWLTQVVGAHCFRPVVEEHFATPGRAILEDIEAKIDASRGVICIVGTRFGALSSYRMPGGPPVSYSQYEWIYAFKSRKPLLTLVASEKVAENEGATGESEELRECQSRFRELVMREKTGWRPFGDPFEFAMSLAAFRWEPWLERGTCD